MEEKYLELFELMNKRIDTLSKRLELMKQMIDLQDETISLLKEGFMANADAIKEIRENKED